MKIKLNVGMASASFRNYFGFRAEDEIDAIYNVNPRTGDIKFSVFGQDIERGLPHYHDLKMMLDIAKGVV